MAGSPIKRARREALAAAQAADIAGKAPDTPESAPAPGHPESDSLRETVSDAQAPKPTRKRATAPKAKRTASPAKQSAPRAKRSAPTAGRKAARAEQPTTEAEQYVSPGTSDTAEQGEDKAEWRRGALHLVTRSSGARAGAHTRTHEALEMHLSACWEDILEAITNGAWPGELAEKYRVKLTQLNAWIAADPERVTQFDLAMESSAEALVHRADKVLREAVKPGDVPRAREMAHHYRWMAERRNNRKFGNKVDVTSGGRALARPQAEIDAELAAIFERTKQRA